MKQRKIYEREKPERKTKKIWREKGDVSVNSKSGKKGKNREKIRRKGGK